MTKCKSLHYTSKTGLQCSLLAAEEQKLFHSLQQRHFSRSEEDIRMEILPYSTFIYLFKVTLHFKKNLSLNT